MTQEVELSGIWWNVDSLRAQRERSWAGRVVHRIVEMQQVYDPDWMCIQEGHDYPNGNLQEMIHAATDWDFRFEPGVKYENGHNGRVKGDEYTEGLATFSKLPIKGSRAVKLGVNPQTNGRDWHCEQHILDTILETDAGDITIGNTHLTSPRPHYISARRREIANLKKHIKDRPLDEAYVIGGDFNSLRPVFIFSPFSAMRHLRDTLDLYTGTRQNPTWIYGAGEKHLLRFNLDYVGVPRESRLTVKEFEVLDRGGSDHTPLRAKFVIDSALTAQA